MLRSIVQDVQFATRSLRKQPGFTAVALLTLALGIGANTAVFSVVDGIMLSPLPYPAPERLVAIWPGHFASSGELELLQQRARSYARGVAAFSPGWGVTLTRSGEPMQLSGARISTNFLTVLGVQPRIGRAFVSGEEVPGSSRVVLLSDALWRGRFGADERIIGRSITLDGSPNTVIGVMPPSFSLFQANADIWMPFEIDRAAGWYKRGGTAFLVGRLHDGITHTAATRELTALVPQLRDALGFDAAYGADARVVSLRDAVVGNLRVTLLVLLAAVGFIVLIASANVGNLLLARASARQKEIAIRTALGASRRRVLRQLVTESVVLAVAGGAFGTLLGGAALSALKSLLPADLPRVDEVGLDLRVLTVCAVVTVASGLLFALAPALHATSIDVDRALRSARGDERSSRAGGRTRGVLVAAEVALALVLVIGAGLMIETMWKLLTVDPGFRAANVLTMRAQPTGEEYGTSERRRQYFLDVLARLEHAPGVLAVGAAQHLPLTSFNWHNEVEIEGKPLAAGETPFRPGYRTIAGDYFRTMSIPLRAGRVFGATDVAGGGEVAIVSDAFARRAFPDENAVGRRFRAGNATRGRWVTIVGVVGNVRHVALAADPEPEFYLDERQFPQSSMAFVIRTAGDPMTVARPLRDLVAAVGPQVPISQLQTLDGLVARSLATPRVVMTLLLVFAMVGLALGAIGIYGVASYVVSLRAREIGIRIALGAARGSVVRMIVGDGMIYTGAGLMIGLVAAFGLTRAMRSLVFGVSPTDVATYAAVTLLLLVTALLATWVPARRAARVDPARALRDA